MTRVCTSPREVTLTGLLGVLLAFAIGCDGSNAHPPQPPPMATRSRVSPAESDRAQETRTYKVVHVVVALCDNTHQSIVPVPSSLGNGEDPKNNLYWGAMYGVKTFFKRSPAWRLLPPPPQGWQRLSIILDRAVFESVATTPPVYVVADAYSGSHMREALRDFFAAASGERAAKINLGAAAKNGIIRAGKNADIICFVGHNGLMDVAAPSIRRKTNAAHPDHAIILACKSRDYFLAPLHRTHCTPLLTTTGLMAPEAYTLDAAIRGWANGDAPEIIRKKASAAYARYQKISEASAHKLFSSGW